MATRGFGEKGTRVNPPAAKANHDEEDVKALLERTDTKDGSGFDSESELPESDFDGFPEDDVEEETEGVE